MLNIEQGSKMISLKLQYNLSIMCILKLKLTEILNTFNTFFFTKHLTLMNEIRAENRTIPLKNKSKIFIYKKKEKNCNQ